MHPILFEIQGFVVYTYGAAMLLAFIVCAISIIYFYPRNDIALFDIYNFFLLILGILFIGQFVRLWISTNFEFQLTWMLFKHQPLGSLSSYPVLFITLIVFYGYCQIRSLNYWLTLDFLVPYAILALSIQRGFGCFMAGCCHGKPTELPWGIIFPHNSSAVEAFGGIAVHPTQLYYSLSSFLIFLILLVYMRLCPQRIHGEVTLLGLSMLSISYLLITFLRGDIILSAWGLSNGQIGATFILVLSAFLFPNLKKLNTQLSKQLD